MRRAMEEKRSGQAMVEFIIAIFAIVLVVAGITDFVVLASRRSDIFGRLRGKAGASAIDASSGDADRLFPGGGAMPRAVVSETALASGFVHDEEYERMELSGAMRKWAFQDKVDSIKAGDEVWMPPLEIGGAE